MKVVINVLCLLGIHCQVRDPYSTSSVEVTASATSIPEPSLTISDIVSAPTPSCNVSRTLFMNCGTPVGALRCLLEGTTCLPDCHIHTYDEWCEHHCRCADHNIGFYAVTNPIELPSTKPNHEHAAVRVVQQSVSTHATEVGAAPDCELSCPSSKITAFCKSYAIAHCNEECAVSVKGVDGPTCAVFCSCVSVGTVRPRSVRG